MTIDEVREHFKNHDTFAKHLGIELVEISNGYGVATMPFDERHRNGMGSTHGGAIFALADMAFAAAANASGVFCVNAQTSISYVSPGKIGPLTGVAKAIYMGRKMVTFDVEITDAANTMVAKAIITGFTKGIPLTPGSPNPEKTAT